MTRMGLVFVCSYTLRTGEAVNRAWAETIAGATRYPNTRSECSAKGKKQSEIKKTISILRQTAKGIEEAKVLCSWQEAGGQVEVEKQYKSIHACIDVDTNRR